MPNRVILIAALSATLAAPIGAEPAKAPAPQAAPVSRPAEVLLAQVEVRNPAPPAESQAPAPVKRPRASRVSSCRCGSELPDQP